MDELNGKVAVVTGGASGIGLAMGRAFLAEGMKVVLADIEVDALAAAAKSISDAVPDADPDESRARLETFVCDVAAPEQVDAMRDFALDRFGAVHLVCNNAGVSTGGPVWAHTAADWNWVLGVNLFGVINGVRSFTPLFIDQGEGHVVNTASMAGLSSPPFMGIYNVSKHAVVTLSETLFGDLALVGAEGVGVSVLCPGWVQTRIHEAGRNRPDPVDAGVEEAAPGFAEIAAALIAGGLEPGDVAAMVVDAVKTRRFYILTHPEWKGMITGRVDRIVEEADPLIAGLPD